MIVKTRHVLEKSVQEITVNNSMTCHPDYEMGLFAAT